MTSLWEASHHSVKGTALSCLLGATVLSDQCCWDGEQSGCLEKWPPGVCPTGTRAPPTTPWKPPASAHSQAGTLAQVPSRGGFLLSPLGARLRPAQRCPDMEVTSQFL